MTSLTLFILRIIHLLTIEYRCIAFVVNKKEIMKRLFSIGVHSIITDQVHMFQPDKKPSKHDVYCDVINDAPELFRGVHCLRCSGPYFPPDNEDDESSIASVTKAMMAHDYLEYIKHNEVQVPYPTKAFGNEPVVPYFSTVDAEMHIMENRRDMLMKNSSLTAVEDSKKLLPRHIPPNVTEFCKKCQHQGDVVEFGTL